MAAPDQAMARQREGPGLVFFVVVEKLKVFEGFRRGREGVSFFFVFSSLFLFFLSLSLSL
jgi:hypothetical protein